MVRTMAQNQIDLTESATIRGVYEGISSFFRPDGTSVVIETLSRDSLKRKYGNLETEKRNFSFAFQFPRTASAQHISIDSSKKSVSSHSEGVRVKCKSTIKKKLLLILRKSPLTSEFSE